MANSRGKSWKRALLVLAIGPLPVAAVLFWGYFTTNDDYDIDVFSAYHAICGAFGGLWGLTAGVLRKSLAKALIGLNLGALTGWAWGKWIQGNIGGDNPIFFGVSMALLLILGAILNARWNLTAKQLIVCLLGSLVFIISLFVGELLALVLEQMFGWYWYTWHELCIMAFVPFGFGMTLFLWLWVDVLPWVERRLESPPVDPAALPP